MRRQNRPKLARLAAATTIGLAVSLLVGPVQATGVAAVAPPPVHGQFDYQIGGPYAPAESVDIASRDRLVSPAAGKYNICYVNALQTQPDPEEPTEEPLYGTVSWWVEHHGDLLVKDGDGEPVIDPDWNEAILDVSTAAKRQAIFDIEKAWIDGCKASGYQAIEPDNLDSYTRSAGAFSFVADKEFMKLFVPYAHSKGLAVAQKNTNSEFGTTGRTEVGFDFAIAEECGFYTECDEYAAAYGNNYIEIEYTDQSVQKFRAACADHGSSVSIIRRDRDVVPKDTAGYRYELCP